MKAGFIRLGIMGKPMNKDLLKAGYELVIFDFNKDTANKVVGCDVVAATSGKKVVERCEVVVTIVPNSPHVCAAVLGENGVAEGARPRTAVIDMSSINPAESRAISAELAKLGIDMPDAPVSGGEPKVIGGTLSVMADDKRELFDKYYNMLIVMAGSIVYVDELGSDSVVELANQVVVAVNVAAISEALTFAERAGTDPESVYQAIRGGLAGSTVVDAKVPMMLSRNFKPDFRIELHIKGPSSASNTIHAISSPAPLTGQLMEVMQDSKADGYEKENHSSIIKYYEKVANTAAEP